MVSAPGSGSSGPGSSPGRDTALCSWARHFTLLIGSYSGLMVSALALNGAVCLVFAGLCSWA